MIHLICLAAVIGIAGSTVCGTPCPESSAAEAVRQALEQDCEAERRRLRREILKPALY